MPTPQRKPQSENDVPADSAVAESRETGGATDAEGSDVVSTTGTGESAEFVGRAAGDDAGYAGQTGAELRNQAEPDR